VDQFTKIIEFDVLNPDTIIGKMIDDEEFRLYYFFFEEKKLNYDKISHSLLADLRVFILYFILFIIILIIIIGIRIIKKYRAKT